MPTLGDHDSCPTPPAPEPRHPTTTPLRLQALHPLDLRPRPPPLVLLRLPGPGGPRGGPVLQDHRPLRPVHIRHHVPHRRECACRWECGEYLLWLYEGDRFEEERRWPDARGQDSHAGRDCASGCYLVYAWVRRVHRYVYHQFLLLYFFVLSVFGRLKTFLH